MVRFGFIGVGNMGEAILRGMISGAVLPPDQIRIYDPDVRKVEMLVAELGVSSAEGMRALAESCDMLLLAVKPDVCGRVIEEHRGLFQEKALISIVTGWSGEKLQDNLPESARVLRVMPNTPAMVGEGMTVFETNDTLKDDERQFAERLFCAIGRVVSVKPELLNATIGVSGSGPAYVYLFIEALADGGVRAGLPRNKAYELAAQTVLGAAKMVLETAQHPGKLKDAVCSPGGTTIEAVASLEKNGLRNAVIEAVQVCVDKADQLSR